MHVLAEGVWYNKSTVLMQTQSVLKSNCLRDLGVCSELVESLLGSRASRDRVHHASGSSSLHVMDNLNHFIQPEAQRVQYASLLTRQHTATSLWPFQQYLSPYDYQYLRTLHYGYVATLSSPKVLEVLQLLATVSSRSRVLVGTERPLSSTKFLVRKELFQVV